ncbi:DUF1819 domain-containing protein [Photobacterium frigidiphilum]|uniref:DUF1819 domain-containing protein n=1 Tax=Photobacterium frigidiphilum TaxID=264736 RepID=A0A2T3JA57_9GAMM|nr:DUF1819 family protein [Photobacterium frigidiphilum]PSU45718.1 DUF1819 domain-containing protein [Photobacterium frigidiphilum]
MTNTNEKLPLTLRPALIHESRVVAEQYIRFKDWSLVREEVLANNLLQARTESTSKTVYGEVSKRLKNLSDEELALMTKSDSDVKHLVWLAICRQYLFTYQFAIEVLSEHFSKSQFQLYPEDYDAFFNAKAEWHSNLDKITQQSRYKAQQIMFKMLVECGLVDENKVMINQQLSATLAGFIQQANVDYLRIYPGDYS